MTHEHIHNEHDVCAECTPKKMNTCNASGGAVYGFGFLGAVIYYIAHATGFWVGALGILKAIVWPAFLVYELLGFLGA